ncbi:MAG: DUF3999 family protein [bacterium]
MNKKVNLFYICLFVIASISFGQFKDYNYKRELTGITGVWHKVILPNEIFAKISSDFSDIRILGITENSDTVEVPYILEIKKKQEIRNEIEFDLINESWDDGGFYFTYEIPGDKTVNRIELELGEDNFDWKVNLEGSSDQNEWFTILKDYRILAIKNELTDYRFTTLHFPDVKYRYLRLYIKTDRAPFLMASKINELKTTDGISQKYNPKSPSVTEDEENKQTVIDINLPMILPVSWVKINLKNKYDYYRPVTIQYLIDSIKTSKGWNYNFNTVMSGTLSSLEKDGVSFPVTVANKFRIVIDNNDNEPLDIGQIEVTGNTVELTARFTEEGDYWLVYGNNKSVKPYYDIENFKERIPAGITALILGEEINISKENSFTEPLFKNKLWLWGIMLIVIITMGWMTVKMMKKK